MLEDSKEGTWYTSCACKDECRMCPYGQSGFDNEHCPATWVVPQMQRGVYKCLRFAKFYLDGE